MSFTIALLDILEVTLSTPHNTLKHFPLLSQFTLIREMGITKLGECKVR